MFKIKKNIKTLFPLSDKDNAELCRKYNIKYIKPEPVKMRKCIRCGKENNADAFFCSGCGYEMKKTVNHNALKQNVNTNNTAPKQPFQSPQNMPNNNAIPNNQKTSVQKQPFQNPITKKLPYRNSLSKTLRTCQTTMQCRIIGMLPCRNSLSGMRGQYPKAMQNRASRISIQKDLSILQNQIKAE